jgi:uncharacterized DUF497 family protein
MEFDWDAGNRGKNLRHGVHDGEIEEALADRHRVPLARVRFGAEVRIIVLCRAQASGKYLRVVYTVRQRRGRRVVRPISAVEMDRAQKRRYLRAR